MDNLQTRKKVPSSFVRGFRQTDGRLSDCRSTDRAGWRVRRTRCAGCRVFRRAVPATSNLSPFSSFPFVRSPPSPPSRCPGSKTGFYPLGQFQLFVCVCVCGECVCVCVIALSVSREYVCMCVPFAFPVALIFSLSQ